MAEKISAFLCGIKMICRFFFFINIFLFLSSQAKEVRFDIDKFQLSLNIPTEYQTLKGYLGRDLVLLGNTFQGKRKSIFIEITDSERVNFSQEKNHLDEFLDNKKNWLNKKQGKYLSSSLDSKELDLKREYIFNTFNYELEGVNYSEGDLFLKCSKSAAVNISYLVSFSQRTTFLGELEKILLTLKCD